MCVLSGVGGFISCWLVQLALLRWGGLIFSIDRMPNRSLRSATNFHGYLRASYRLNQWQSSRVKFSYLFFLLSSPTSLSALPHTRIARTTWRTTFHSASEPDQIMKGTTVGTTDSFVRPRTRRRLLQKPRLSSTKNPIMLRSTRMA